jgi:tRNA(Ile2) C34 agmatinyltransferase TiaS
VEDKLIKVIKGLCPHCTGDGPSKYVFAVPSKGGDGLYFRCNECGNKVKYWQEVKVPESEWIAAGRP